MIHNFNTLQEAPTLQEGPPLKEAPIGVGSHKGAMGRGCVFVELHVGFRNHIYLILMNDYVLYRRLLLYWRSKLE